MRKSLFYYLVEYVLPCLMCIIIGICIQIYLIKHHNRLAPNRHASFINTQYAR